MPLGRSGQRCFGRRTRPVLSPVQNRRMWWPTKQFTPPPRGRAACPCWPPRLDFDRAATEPAWRGPWLGDAGGPGELESGRVLGGVTGGPRHRRAQRGLRADRRRAALRAVARGIASFGPTTRRPDHAQARPRLGEGQRQSGMRISPAQVRARGVRDADDLVSCPNPPAPPPPALHLVRGSSRPAGGLRVCSPWTSLSRRCRRHRYIEIPGARRRRCIAPPGPACYSVHRVERRADSGRSHSLQGRGREPAGSHKPNTAVPLGHNAKAGVRTHYRDRGRPRGIGAGLRLCPLRPRMRSVADRGRRATTRSPTGAS